MRKFKSGATRDAPIGKLHYAGYLSPFVLRRYAEFMRKHQTQPNGSVRAPDNWKLGIPIEVYLDSEWRHHMEFWSAIEGGGFNEEAACAILFNVMGALHEHLTHGKKFPK